MDLWVRTRSLRAAAAAASMATMGGVLSRGRPGDTSSCVWRRRPCSCSRCCTRSAALAPCRAAPPLSGSPVLVRQGGPPSRPAPGAGASAIRRGAPSPSIVGQRLMWVPAADRTASTRATRPCSTPTTRPSCTTRGGPPQLASEGPHLAPTISAPRPPTRAAPSSTRRLWPRRRATGSGPPTCWPRWSRSWSSARSPTARCCCA
jgi:hypothetical protein